MVDFQSRDTRRGPSKEAAADEETDDEPGQGEASPTDPADDHPTEAEPSDSGEAGLFVLSIDDGPDDTATVVVDALEADGRTVVDQESVTAGYDAVQSAIDRVVTRRDVAAVLTVGATGVGPRDVTVEAVEPLFEKELPGFGELFRVSYHERVGPDVIGMRPTAGISDGVPVFCLPGEAEAARFTVGDIVLETLDGLLEKTADSA